jgi:hypothetical protein
MKIRTPILIMSLFAMMLITILSAFTHTPTIAQNPTPTLDPIYIRSTEIVAEATLTAQVGGDFTSIGTSTPLAGLCNSLMYRNLSDVEAQIKASLGVITTLLDNFTVEALLLEETTDCVTFTQRELTITITVPLRAIDEISNETQLGDTLATIVVNLLANSQLDVLSNPTLVVEFTYGNQTRSLSASWDDARNLVSTGIRGEEVVNRITLLGIEEN